MLLQILAQLRPVDAFHASFRESPPEAHVAIGTAGFGAWLAHIDWASAIAFAGYVTMVVSGVVIQLWKQVSVARVQIQAAEQELADQAAARHRRPDPAPDPAG